VNVVREMFGLMTAESAASAIVICSGIFTQEAKNFAEGKPIDLVDGAQLEALIGQVRRAPREAAARRCVSSPQLPFVRVVEAGWS
jgi:restriction system protein